MKKINLRKFNMHVLRKLPAHEKKITIATVLTIVRFACAPCVVVAMIGGYWGSAFILFVLAAFTDTIDGSLARLRNEKTFLGACLDPISDKVLLLSCFTTLAFVDTPLFSIPRWFVALIVGKEVLQVGGAFILYMIRGHLDIRPTRLGKVTMAVQVGFIVWLFSCYFFQWLPIKTYYTMLGLVIVLVFASFAQYVNIGMQLF